MTIYVSVLSPRLNVIRGWAILEIFEVFELEMKSHHRLARHYGSTLTVYSNADPLVVTVIMLSVSFL